MSQAASILMSSIAPIPGPDVYRHCLVQNGKQAREWGKPPKEQLHLAYYLICFYVCN